MLFLGIAAKNLARRPLRSLLTMLGLGFAAAGLIMLVGLARGLEGAWSQSLLDRGVHLVVSPKGAVEVLAGTLEQSVVGALAREPGVTAAAGELVSLLALAKDRTVAAAGWEPGSFLWDTMTWVAGGPPTGAGQVALGENLATALGLSPGDRLELWGREFSLTGIARSTSALNLGGAFFPLATLQELVGKRGLVTFVNLRLTAPDDAAALASTRAALARAYPGLAFAPTAEVTRDNRILGIFQAMAWGTSLLAIVISAVFVLNTMMMAVAERTREIGLLGAVGWSRARIMALVLGEGALLALLGGLLGVALGLAGLQFLTAHTGLGAFLTPRVSAGFLGQALGGTVLLGTLGSLYPAWRAMNLRAAQALKYE
ncbi:MAG: ABC transporter permease [Deltaproteobacteria bacterium]|nr:ABC transporter permease [Deltaproteobacteria bacterium]